MLYKYVSNNTSQYLCSSYCSEEIDISFTTTQAETYIMIFALCFQRSCSDCPAGTMQPDSGATTCIECPAGRFQESRGQTVCNSCPPGRVQVQEGQSRCDSCPSGTIQPNRGSVECIECQPGSYSSGPRNTVCSPCYPGMYYVVVGSICFLANFDVPTRL